MMNRRIVIPALLVVLALGAAGVWLTFGSSTIDVAFSPTPTVSSTPSPSSDAEMLFVGDIMLSRSVGELMAAKNDYRWPFEKIADFLNAPDLTFANLETTVSTRGTRVGSIYSFRSDPRAVAGLTHAGFDLLSIANNHIWDYSREAFVDTMDHLASAGISYVGGGHDAVEARAGVVKDIRGTKVGFLAYTNLLPKAVAATVGSPGAAVYDEVQMIQDIQALKPRADVIVVSFHWGDEYQTRHNALQEQIAHTAIDAGADLIIGHHPHVVQDIEQYQGKYIVYSLGNFIFDQNFSTATMTGLAVKVFLKDKEIDSIQEIPIHISREYQATAAQAVSILDASRITKKPFGLFATPADSPVQPERFSGYHSGADFETTVGEANVDIVVPVLCDGPLIVKKTAGGYGGVVVQSCNLNNQAVTVVYGHIKLASVTAPINQQLKKGDTIGILGKGFSSETDGERKHLHLGIHKGSAINILGYVQKQSDLSAWLDPADFLN